ncbi:Wzz/FepE/Etk N-terminal domain-containing protein [Sulfuricella sp.]|uniref:Wzz/FepE/Etk N-terminal domain-containing protein n=1 Tax=Sulfuricella sp. TaxID=2099377 RepID=UPI002C8EE5FF|nr:Wzz/FepE/Etk N-terminal domain-containing protein [Sulfuricella sp.]HUX65241.1 Wzz/FepE/Etk N-terminal domain-containing protein [Sulfuricella sp.]
MADDMTNQTDNQISPDEISLLEIWQVLVRQKKWVIGIPVLALIAAAAVSALIPPVWEATLVGQIGQIGQVGQQLIEPVARVVERIKQKPFQGEVLVSMGIPKDEENSKGKLYRDSIKVQILPNTDLIEIKVRGYSREEAKRNAEATIGRLSKLHEELAQPTIQRLTQQMERLKQQINESREERESLKNTQPNKSKTDSGGRFMESIIQANILVQRDGELRNLEQLKLSYEEQLSPLRTYPTARIDSTYVSEKPVAPKKGLIVVLSGVLGLMAGIFAAFVLNAIQARKPRD